MEYQFKGYDLRELAHCWGIVDSAEWKDEVDNQDAIADEIREYIYGSYGTDREFAVAKDVRAFIGKLAEQTPGYDGPIWEGMLKVEDDHTLLHFAANMIRLMWT